MSFDPDCYALAKSFLSDHRAPPAQITALAQAIQDNIEDFLSDLESECICTARPARSTDLSPPEPTRNPRCPLHGDLRHVDPDAARDAILDR